MTQTPPPQTPRRNVAEMRAVRPIVWPAYAVAIAALCLALVALGFNLSISAERTRLRAELGVQTGREATLIRELALERLATADLISPLSKRFDLPGGEVVVSREGRVYVAMNAMATLPPGMVYRVWIARPNQTAFRLLTSFVPNRSGVAVIPLSVPASAIGTLAVDKARENAKAVMGTPLFTVTLQ